MRTASWLKRGREACCRHQLVTQQNPVRRQSPAAEMPFQQQIDAGLLQFRLLGRARSDLSDVLWRGEQPIGRIDYDLSKPCIPASKAISRLLST